MNINRYAPLRFITAGSVDDGKSTLIGRLLYDSKALLGDQLLSLDQSKNHDEVIDFSVLTDGLEAEREQGITIDVAYRYFSTARRKFIIADTPGHEQYTRNMVTGASTASAAVVLIDASQLDFEQENIELLAQTRRHSLILKQLHCPHIVVAVNKIDLLDYSEEKFNRICAAYGKFAEQLGLNNIHYVPVSALRGDNIVYASNNTPWYQGVPLLTILEELPTDSNVNLDSNNFHFPVQLVSRQDNDKQDDFRGYQGQIEAGSVKVGQRIRIEPTGFESVVSAIYSPNGEVESAQAGEQITLCLADDIDISRGDALVDANSSVVGSRRVQATLCWFERRALNPARKYLLKHCTQTIFAKVSSIEHVLDINNGQEITDIETLKLNDIGEVNLTLSKPISATDYQTNHGTGAFILIDESTYHTVAAGMINYLD